MINVKKRVFFSQTLLAFALFASLGPATTWADRPITPKLLPEQTLVYFRVANMPDLIEKFQQTSTGRLAKDEQLKPLLGQVLANRR